MIRRLEHFQGKWTPVFRPETRRGMSLAIATYLISAVLLTANVAAAKPSDRDEIAAVTQAIVTGFSTRNMDMIMSSYSPNEDLIVFDISPPIKYVGAKAVRALNDYWLKSFTGKIEGSYSDLNVTVVGPVAYGYNVQHWKFTRPDNSVFEFTTRLTNVYRKIDGRWRIVQEHGSVPVDLAKLTPVLDAK